MGKIIFPHLKVGKAKENLSNLSEIRSDEVAETKARSSNILTNTSRVPFSSSASEDAGVLAMSCNKLFAC